MNIDPVTGEFRLNERGEEIPDPTPIEVPAGMKRPETLAEQVQRLVRRQVSDYAALHGHETFEEADDLEMDDDFDPSTPYEVEFDPVLGRDLTAADFKDAQRREWLREQYLLAERNAIRAEERQEAINEAYKAARRKEVRQATSPAPPPADASPEPKKPA